MANEKILGYKIFAIAKSGRRDASPATLSKALLDATLNGKKFYSRFLVTLNSSLYSVLRPGLLAHRNINTSVNTEVTDIDLANQVAKNFNTKLKKVLSSEKNKTCEMELYEICSSLVSFLKAAQQQADHYRIILAPNNDLKAKQSKVHQDLSYFNVHSSAFGFARNRSALDCANYHLLYHDKKVELLINLDVKNFFGSITEKDLCSSLSAHGLDQDQIKQLLETSTILFTKKNAISLMIDACLAMCDRQTIHTFLLNNTRSHLSSYFHGAVSSTFFHQFMKKYLYILVNFALKKKWIQLEDVIEVSKSLLNLGPSIKLNSRFLPQGSPTSPTLSNLASKRLDYRLSGFAQKHEGLYSRYADDMSFTWNKRYGQKFINLFIHSVGKIIKQHGLRLNPKKTRVIGKGGKMDIVGYVINSGKPTISPKYISAVRKEILELGNSTNAHKYKTVMSFERKVESIKGKISFIDSASPEKAQKLNRLVYELVSPNVVESRRIEV